MRGYTLLRNVGDEAAKSWLIVGEPKTRRDLWNCATIPGQSTLKEGSKLGAVKPHHDAEPPRKWGSLLSRLGKGTAPPPPLHPPPAEATSPLHPEQKTPANDVKSRTGSEKRQRKHVRATRLDDDELMKLEARAGTAGQSVGAYMRACSLETAGPRARRRASVDRDLLARSNAELNRVGSNLNQISRTLNIAALDDDDRELAKTVTELNRPIAAAVAEVSATLGAVRQALGYDSQG